MGLPTHFRERNYLEFDAGESPHGGAQTAAAHCSDRWPSGVTYTHALAIWCQVAC